MLRRVVLSTLSAGCILQTAFIMDDSVGNDLAASIAMHNTTQLSSSSSAATALAPLFFFALPLPVAAGE